MDPWTLPFEGNPLVTKYVLSIVYPTHARYIFKLEGMLKKHTIANVCWARYGQNRIIT